MPILLNALFNKNDNLNFHYAGEPILLFVII